LLVSVPTDNLAARVVDRSGAGIVVSPGDVAAFLGAADRLSADEELRAELGLRGRAYAQSTFDVAALARRFEEVLERASGARR
jgi:glycosyltransferase involved in cell wall biosynthesis